MVRPITLTLLALIGLTLASLLFGKGSLQHVVSLEQQLREQQSANDAARQRNQRLAAEVADLREGLEMVEETARRELGMVRPDELLVLYTPQKR